jgi:asparagine synthetase B (glutamine-hydrolysing)
MMTPPMPKAKTERLIVREIDGEPLVYDRSRAAASCLKSYRGQGESYSEVILRLAAGEK